MSLFGFADINFNKSNSPVNGPLRALEGSQFASGALRYPSDIGNYDKGHYIVFYIREQKNSIYRQDAGIPDSVINAASMGGTFENIPLVNNPLSSFGSSILGKLNSGLSQLNSATGGKLSGVTSAIGGAAGGLVGSINNIFGQAPSIVSGDAATTQGILENNIKEITNNRFINTTQLTRDAIALYMPDTLAFSQQQGYDNATPGNELIGQLAAAGVSAAQSYQKSGGNIVDKLSAAGASIMKSAVLKTADASKGLLGESTGAVAFAAAGVAKNPMMELIYSSPSFRTFQFDFLFYPRDEKEALEVQKIIEKFRFHSSPELIPDSQGFMVPPSQFDIRFYYGGSQNPNIPQIATCVLTGIDVNYAPNGWSAYEIPGQSSPTLGGTGMPVAIQMTLQMQEVEILTKEDYSTFGGTSSSPPGLLDIASTAVSSLTKNF
jgi:hypothetical protein